MEARFLVRFFNRALLLLTLSLHATAALDNIVLLAEKRSPVLEKLQQQLQTIAPDFSYKISTPGSAISIQPDDYVILVGRSAASHFDYAKHSRNISVLLTSEQCEKLNVQTCIWIEPPLTRQLRLANLVLPGNKKIGFLVNNKQQAEQVLSELSDAQREMLKVVALDDYENINQALFNALKNTRLLLGHYNNKIYSANNIKNILITSYRQHKVLVGPSRAYLKAGSFATTFSGLSHIAQRIVDVIKHHKDTKSWLVPGYNPYYKILFNQQVARSLNIRVANDELLEQRMREEK